MFRGSFSKVALALSIWMAVISVSPANLSAQGSGYSLTLTNFSGLDIKHVYLSESGQPDWGVDQLHAVILHDHAQYIIYDIPFGDYDVKLVDQDGDTCHLFRIHMFRNYTWTLNREWLLRCEFGR